MRRDGSAASGGGEGGFGLGGRVRAVAWGKRGVEGRRQERARSLWWRPGTQLTAQASSFGEADRNREGRDRDGICVRGRAALHACWRPAYTGVGSEEDLNSQSAGARYRNTYRE